MKPVPSQIYSFLHVAYIGVDRVDGALFDAGHNRWIQDTPTPQTISVHVRAVNHLQGALDRAVIAATWVYDGLDPLVDGPFQLKPGDSHSVTFNFPPLVNGFIAALYLDLLETNPPWNPNQQPTEIGSGLVLRFEATQRWAQLHTLVRPS